MHVRPRLAHHFPHHFHGPPLLPHRTTTATLSPRQPKQKGQTVQPATDCHLAKQGSKHLVGPTGRLIHGSTATQPATHCSGCVLCDRLLAGGHLWYSCNHGSNPQPSTSTHVSRTLGTCVAQPNKSHLKGTAPAGQRQQQHQRPGSQIPGQAKGATSRHELLGHVLIIVSDHYKRVAHSTPDTIGTCTGRTPCGHTQAKHTMQCIPWNSKHPPTHA